LRHRGLKVRLARAAQKRTKEARDMPKVSSENAQVEDHGVVLDRHGEVDGYTVNIVEFRQDMDQTPMLKGLPDDRCQCPHWGYVLKGSLTYRFADHDEVVAGGRRLLSSAWP